MKKIFLFLVMLVLTTAAISQRCPIDFKRNNGFGTDCTALITLTFPSTVTCEDASAYTILHVYQDGVELAVTFVRYSIDCTGSQPKITYCGSGGNIPPSGDLTFDFQTNGGPLTCFVPGPGGGPLPVKLSSFYARRNNNNVGLSWKTESEINSKEFVLERRTGNSFTTVATIAAANKSTGSSYSYSDNNLNKGVSLYRLKIIDLDGSFSYSSISAVRGTSSTADFTIFPNPNNGNAKVTISDISEPTDVQLLDLSGRVIKKISLTNTNTVNLNSLQKGMYMIRITNKTSGESSTQKLSVVN